MTPAEELELIRIRARARARAAGAAPNDGGPTAPVSEPEDWFRSFGAGLERFAAGMAGAQGDLHNMRRTVLTEAARNLAPLVGRHLNDRDAAAYGDMAERALEAVPSPMSPIPTLPAPGGGSLSLPAPSSEDAARVIEHIQGAPIYEPQTQGGRYAQAIGEFAPNALIPGGLAARAARVLVPAAASETAGELTAGTPFEGPARFAGALVGGIGTEAGIGALARRAAIPPPRPAVNALEDEFGPLTEGERSGSPRQRLTEDDWRRGIGSERAQSTMRAFDARRGRTVRDRAMGIVTRDQPALSENVGEAGVILGDELRSERVALRDRATQQLNQAFERMKTEEVPASDDLTARIADTAREYGFELPSGARGPLTNLQDQIARGEATQANVERARQQLNRELGSAINNRDDATEFVYSRIIGALDDWRSGVVRDPALKRAIDEGRAMWSEQASLFGRQGRTELSTGHAGRMDPGGRAIDRAINTDLTGEQIIDSVVGAGTRPSAQALGAVRRIRQLATGRIVYTNRNAQSGVRVPGRTAVRGEASGDGLDMRLRNARRFAADTADSPAAQRYFGGKPQQPVEIIQSLREGVWHRILRPLDDYLTRAEQLGEGGMLPAQRMVTQLDNALNRAGREIMEQLYTKRELSAMRRLLRYFQSIVPPQGAAVSGTSSAIYRMITAALNKAIGIVPGLGPVVQASASIAEEATTTAAAQRAIAPRRPTQPVRRMSAPIAPTPIAPAVSGGIGAMYPPEERRGRIGEYVGGP